jgi:DNA-binding NarL/FixJ family response regulator
MQSLRGAGAALPIGDPQRPTGRRRPAISILIADDHEVLRRGLRQLLEEQDGYFVCGEAATGRDAVELAKQLRPDVTILDLTMPDLNGLEAARQIKRAQPHTEILIFTMHESEELIRQVLSAGARGYILKSDATRLIIAGVEALAAHKPFFTSSVAEAILNVYLRSHAPAAEDAAPASLLSPREREIAQLLAEGRGNKMIASLLNLSVKTVETHRSAIMRKIGTNSIAGVVRYAVRNKLIEP